jgi:hypothetical protein
MTASLDRTDRLERRSYRAADLIMQWHLGNRRHVIRELGMSQGAIASHLNSRLIAAIALHGFTSEVKAQRAAAFEIMEWITREKGL